MCNNDLVLHILHLIFDSLEAIQVRSSGIKKYSDFTSNPEGMMIADSICMKLTAIGESVKNLDKITEKTLLVKYDEIPWKNVMGVRDVLVHHYFDVDAEEIFRICKEDIPQLKKVIFRIISDLES